MSQSQAPQGDAVELRALRRALSAQYHAALAMLREAVELCPDELWDSDEHTTRCWQLAYHTLFYTHLYSQVDEASFVPWERHVFDVQVPDGIPGPPDPDSELPLIAPPYSKPDVLDYLDFCDRSIDAALEAMDLNSATSGFDWYPIPKLEHQLVNIRHIQHGAAQLADRVRKTASLGVAWVGSLRTRGGDVP